MLLVVVCLNSVHGMYYTNSTEAQLYCCAWHHIGLFHQGGSVDDPRRGGGGGPPVHHRHHLPLPNNGKIQPRLSHVNRMPVASMRMRMDDYAPPKPRRNDQGGLVSLTVTEAMTQWLRWASLSLPPMGLLCHAFLVMVQICGCNILPYCDQFLSTILPNLFHFLTYIHNLPMVEWLKRASLSSSLHPQLSGSEGLATPRYDLRWEI